MRMYCATFSFTQKADPNSPYGCEHSIDVSVVEPELSHETYLVFKTDRWAMYDSELDSLGLKLKRLRTMARAHLPRENNGQS